jgi:catechol 2,3-dioxygenase-like lactoylglutathione lyase family enzyme
MLPIPEMTTAATTSGALVAVAASAARRTRGDLGIAAVDHGFLLTFSAGWGWTGLLLATTLRLVPGRAENAGHTVQVGIYAGAAVAPFAFGALSSVLGFAGAALIAAVAAVAGASLTTAGAPTLRALVTLSASARSTRHREGAFRTVVLATPSSAVDVDSPEGTGVINETARNEDQPMAVRRVVPDLKSESLEKAKAFYTHVLGLEVVMDHGWIVTLADPQRPEVQLSIMTHDATAPVVPVASIQVDDVDASYKAARAAGAEIVHELTEEPWGVRRFFVRDPDGHVINVLAHN